MDTALLHGRAVSAALLLFSHLSPFPLFSSPAVHNAVGVFLLVGTALSGIVMVVGGVVAVIGLLALLPPAGTPVLGVLASIAAGLVAIPAAAGTAAAVLGSNGLAGAWDDLKQRAGPIIVALASIAASLFLWKAPIGVVLDLMHGLSFGVNGMLAVFGGLKGAAGALFGAPKLTQASAA